MIFLSRSKRVFGFFALCRKVASPGEECAKANLKRRDQRQAQAYRESKLDLRLFT
jgi:hypothetical protein